MRTEVASDVNMVDLSVMVEAHQSSGLEIWLHDHQPLITMSNHHCAIRATAVHTHSQQRLQGTSRRRHPLYPICGLHHSTGHIYPLLDPQLTIPVPLLWIRHIW